MEQTLGTYTDAFEADEAIEKWNSHLRLRVGRQHDTIAVSQSSNLYCLERSRPIERLSSFGSNTMLSAILFAVAISGAYFFTVVPWFLASGGNFWRASPFIVASVIVACLLGLWYERGLRSEQVSPTVGRRRRLAFAIACS